MLSMCCPCEVSPQLKTDCSADKGLLFEPMSISNLSTVTFRVRVVPQLNKTVQLVTYV